MSRQAEPFVSTSRASLPLLLVPGPREAFRRKDPRLFPRRRPHRFRRAGRRPCGDAQGQPEVDLDQGHALALGLVLVRRPPQLLMAPRLRPALCTRLCRRPRGFAPEGDEPLRALLATGRALRSRLAVRPPLAGGARLGAPCDRGQLTACLPRAGEAQRSPAIGRSRSGGGPPSRLTDRPVPHPIGARWTSAPADPPPLGGGEQSPRCRHRTAARKQKGRASQPALSISSDQTA